MYGMKKRGLFGSMMQPDEELGGIWGASLPKQQPMQAPMQQPMEQPAEKPAGFWQGGNKFGWRDGLAGVLAAVGDAFANGAGMPTGAVQNLAGGRIKAIEEAKTMAAKAAELKQRQAALDANNVPKAQQQLILNGLATYKDVQPADNTPAWFKDSQFYNNLTPEQREAVNTYLDVSRPVTTNTARGTEFVPRSQFAPQLPTQPVGTLTPVGPTMGNTPAPQTGSNEFPDELTPDQYRVTVQSLGKERTDEWMRRNGIRLRGF